MLLLGNKLITVKGLSYDLSPEDISVMNTKHKLNGVKRFHMYRVQKLGSCTDLHYTDNPMYHKNLTTEVFN